jgi:multiple sugar transport system permease protein
MTSQPNIGTLVTDGDAEVRDPHERVKGAAFERHSMSRRVWLTRRLPIYLLLIVGAAIMLFPFYWMVITSLKTLQEANLSPPTLYPHAWQFSNYPAAFNRPPSGFGRYFLNSTLIAGVGTLLQVLVSILAAFAFARLDFRGRNALFVLVLGTMMVPFEAKVVPNFVLIRHLPFLGGNDWTGFGGSGLYDTYSGMILPGIASAFGIFLLRQAFMQIPRDFWDAARVDGAGEWAFIWRILVPITMPAIFTVALFGFLSRWNDLLWPLVVTQTEAIRPVQVGLIMFSGDEGSFFHLMMAASTMVAAPIIVLFFFVQKRFIEGIAAFGVK